MGEAGERGGEVTKEKSGLIVIQRGPMASDLKHISDGAWGDYEYE
jgi:hypothetical protein